MTINISFTSGLVIFSYLNAGYFNILLFVSALVNASNISTRFGHFPRFLRPSLSDDKGVKGINRVAYTGTAGIGSTYIRDTYARGTGAGDTFSARGACVKDVFVGGTCAESTYA